MVKLHWLQQELVLQKLGTGPELDTHWNLLKNGYTLPIQSDVQEMRHREGCIPWARQGGKGAFPVHHDERLGYGCIL